MTLTAGSCRYDLKSANHIHPFRARARAVKEQVHFDFSLAEGEVLGVEVQGPVVAELRREHPAAWWPSLAHPDWPCSVPACFLILILQSSYGFCKLSDIHPPNPRSAYQSRVLLYAP